MTLETIRTMRTMRTMRTLVCGRKGDNKAPRSCKDLMAENETKWQKRRASCELWKQNNRERYLRVKRECAARPAYLARRRELYQAKRSLHRSRPTTETKDLSTSRNLHDDKTATEIAN